MIKSIFIVFSLLGALSTFAVECGDTITDKVRLTEDLDCSSYQGFAALILRDNAILQGNNFRIISPNTSAGIYAEGGNIKVRSTQIIVDESSIGVMAYNVSKMIVNKSNISNARIGVDYSTEDEFACDRLRISNSTLTNNEFAAKVNAPNCDYTPRFVNNDFSNSKNYALNIISKKIRIAEKQNNSFFQSQNGLLLSASEKITLAGLDLSDDQIAGTSIFVYSSNIVRLKNLVLANSTESIHIYDAADIKLRNVSADASDIALRVTNESQDTNLKIVGSNLVSDIALIANSFGSATFNEVSTKKSNLLGAVVENY